MKVSQGSPWGRLLTRLLMSVTPMHMMLVALCGDAVDIDRLDQFSPEHASHLWAVLKELDIDPVRYHPI